MSSQVFRPRESIYDLLPKEEVKIEKPPRYVSKFRPTVVQEKKLTIKPKRTMGPAKVEVPSPENFLKKHSKEPVLPDKSQCAQEGRIHPLKKPPVPPRTEIPPMSSHTERDFTKTCTFVPSKPKPIRVDNNRGHREALENSGLVPKYIKKKDFGKVPVYLQHRNEAERKKQEEYDNYVKEQREKEAMKQLSEEKRQAILKGLKMNWDKIHHEYQGLSLVIDTLSKKAHKERLELAIKKLEKDIDYFERFTIIYIANN